MFYQPYRKALFVWAATFLDNVFICLGSGREHVGVPMGDDPHSHKPTWLGELGTGGQFAAQNREDPASYVIFFGKDTTININKP